MLLEATYIFEYEDNIISTEEIYVDPFENRRYRKFGMEYEPINYTGTGADNQTSHPQIVHEALATGDIESGRYSKDLFYYLADVDAYVKLSYMVYEEEGQPLKEVFKTIFLDRLSN